MSRNVTDLLAGGRVRPLLSLGLLVVAVFGPVFWFDFVRWDDPVNIAHNPLLTEPWSRELLAKLVNGDTALRFKPLPWLLYRATHTLFGFQPGAWHALNLALHFGAVAMAWVVFRATLARLRPATPEATRHFLAWLGAAVWAVHPAHVEAAAWATATPYPLMVIFLLGSFWFYLRATDPAAGAARPRLLVWSWLLAVGSYASYPVGVTYGLWLVVADLWILRVAPRGVRPLAAGLRWAVRPLLFLLPAVASVLVTFQSSSTTPWLYPAPATLAEVSVPVRLEMAAAMLASVWTHFFWPFGMTPNNPMIPPEMIHGPLILGMAALAIGVVGAALAARRRAPGFTGTVLGSAALALPVLGFTQWPTWSVADRHVYLPHLVLTGAVIVWLAARTRFSSSPTVVKPDLRAGLSRASEEPSANQPARSSGSTLVTGLLVLAALAWLGRQQVMIWRNTDSLFRYLEQQPQFTWNATQQAYIYQLWGAQLEEDRHPAEARAKHDRARKILVEAMLAEAGGKNWRQALALAQRLEQSFGLSPALRRERVRWLLAQGAWEAARPDLQRVRRELPEDPVTEELVREWQRQAGGKDL